MERRKTEKVILATIGGIASGAILGLLFAPEKGTKTRKKLSKQGDQYLKTMRKDIKKMRKYLNEKAKGVKTEIVETGQNAKNKGEALVNEAKKLTSYDDWTKEELYEKAKETEIEGYSQMNKSELIEALKKNNFSFIH